MDNIIYKVQSNITFSSTPNKEDQKKVSINYERFVGSYRYNTSKPIHEICYYCNKKKCSCGGCPETDFYTIPDRIFKPPLCERCICCDNKKPDTDSEIINDTGKSLDTLIRERKGKHLKKYTIEAYENGEFTKTGNTRFEKEEAF